MSRLGHLARSRGPLLGVAALTGGLLGAAGAHPRAHDEASLLAALSELGAGQVDTLAWEPARSTLSELLWGRPVLFTAREGDGPHDIYRAFVRRSPSGALLQVRAPRNLTTTALADESSLDCDATTCAYATEQEARVTSLTLLDPSGFTPSRDLGWAGRAQLALRNWLETGETKGIGRTDWLLEPSVAHVEIHSTPTHLVLSLEGRRVEVSRSAVFRHASSCSTSAFDCVRRDFEPSTFWQWGADNARALLGPGPVAYVEGRVFSAVDRVHRLLHTSSAEPLPARAPVAVAPTHGDHETTLAWPPANLPPLLRGAPADDGHFRPWRFGGDPKLAPYFYRAVIHPDPERAYAEVHLLAIDSSRLELHVRAGYEDPKPDSGPPGSGHVPEEPARFRRIVATFNGAFKSVHGPYGMQAEGRTLVAPSPGAATVRIDSDGGIGFGNWPIAEGGTAEPPAGLEGLSEFRQNLDPLVEKGRANPRGRAVWGEHLYGSLVPAERSALCTTRAGQLYYAWSPEISAEALAAALVHAGCDYAVHLDMNPGHCTFAQNRMESFQPLVARGEVLDPRMRVNANRYLRWSPQDFFYLAERSALPERSRLDWQPLAEGALAPLRGRGNAGSLPVELERVALGSVRLGLVAGTAEPRQEPAVEQRATMTWGLGHRTPGTRGGLLRGLTTISPLVRSDASLRLPARGTPTLLAPGIPLTPEADVDVVQLPVLARDGELVPLARELGDRRLRAAACLSSDGHLLVGRVEHDTVAPLVGLLLEEGCSLVVALDRGSHHPATFERGTGTAPLELTPRPESLLFATERPLAPRAYVFE
ncbi:MAG TPA: hypothetical protein VLC09_09745 [Polyangiaceae bacterium]|nr:hypothetical protein [Polyangiaceae bacterium]